MRETKPPTAVVCLDAAAPPLEKELRLHLADSCHGGPGFSRFDMYSTSYRITCVHLTRVDKKTHNAEAKARL